MRHIPQIITGLLFACSLLIDANRHGKTRQVTENFWVTLAAISINVAVLWWGGFWRLQ